GKTKVAATARPHEALNKKNRGGATKSTGPQKLRQVNSSLPGTTNLLSPFFSWPHHLFKFSEATLRAPLRFSASLRYLSHCLNLFLEALTFDFWPSTFNFPALPARVQ